jgi:hypothetical protein
MSWIRESACYGISYSTASHESRSYPMQFRRRFQWEGIVFVVVIDRRHPDRRTDGDDVPVVDLRGGSSSRPSIYPPAIYDDERRAAADRLDDREYYRGDDDANDEDDDEDDVEAAAGMVNVTTAATMMISSFHRIKNSRVKVPFKILV